MRFFRYILFLSILSSCSQPSEDKLFTNLSPTETGIDFQNNLTFDKDFNIYTYRNFFNGGGVAAGDFNKDGLYDLYFTSNQKQNKLYINKGNFKFEDVTEKAGVGGKRGWSTGVSLADINGDGNLDIYVCNSGNLKGDNKQNELFINNGDMTFTEAAHEYGLDDSGYSTHASFFDYDKDGDLDMYLLNNSFQAIGSFNLRKNERHKRDSLGGDKLFKNENGRFKDVSVDAGILGSVIGFGLGVTVGDIDNDGWQDIYVSNDFFERDYLYINQKDGTFKEMLPNQINSLCAASMGADMADINNDQLPELFVTDMLPRTNERLKTVTTFEDWNRYTYNLSNDYYHQFTRNTLQLNNGNGSFSEIGRLAKVEATDWSWGALIADFDNDGLRDVFVSNGISRDLTNQDYLQFASSEEFVKKVVNGNKVDYEKLVEAIPSNKISNFGFKNQSNFSFSDETKSWGLDTPGFSSGSAYVDLDNDGDMDLVTNNVNMPAFVYRNNLYEMQSKANFVKFDLTGSGKNTMAIGSVIKIFYQGKSAYLEQAPIRGFQSTVDSRLNFGIGENTIIDSAIVIWPDQTITRLRSIKANQTIRLKQGDQSLRASILNESVQVTRKRFKDVTNEYGVSYRHHEDDFVDFDRDRLIFHMLSTEGPKLSVADVNKDGLDDFYIGGAKGQPGELHLQNNEGKFQSINGELFKQFSDSEDMGSVFFDADNDQDMDLYVCSGGNEFSAGSTSFRDRLYLNDGTGNFVLSNQVLPTFEALESSSCVKAADYDNDGDTDLFVGTRLIPFSYGYPMNGYILNNDGLGNFLNVTKKAAPSLEKVGMITDAFWADLDGDADFDLLIVGEYMPIRVLIQEKGKFKDKTEDAGTSGLTGWWNTIRAADLDKDGDMDFVLGNHGLNSRFRATSDHPVTMYVNDFDQNGSIEQIICTYEGDNNYPMVLRHDLVSQIPSLKKKYLRYDSYKNQRIEDVFSTNQLSTALKLEAKELRSIALMNDGKAHFKSMPLPIEAQFSPVYGILINDLDNDGVVDILLGGNLYKVKPEVGRYDASYGSFLKGKGNGEFITVLNRDCGLKLDGEVRDIQSITIGKRKLIFVARNNDSPVILSYE